MGIEYREYLLSTDDSGRFGQPILGLDWQAGVSGKLLDCCEYVLQSKRHYR